MQAHLQFGTRVVVVEIRNAKVTGRAQANVNCSTNSSYGSVTSSTRTIHSPGCNSPSDLTSCDPIQPKIEGDDSFYPTTSAAATQARVHAEDDECDGSSMSDQVRVKLEHPDNYPSWNTRASLPPLTLSVPTDMANATTHPSTILRLRVRVTNFGVSILPYMMTNYSCTYKFSW